MGHPPARNFNAVRLGGVEERPTRVGLVRVGGFVVPRNVLVRLNDLTVFAFQKHP
jgi:hypothetical protein